MSATMRLLTHALTALALATVAQSATNCKKFSQLQIRESIAFSCTSECLDSIGGVYGTEVYQKDSDICGAALHAGAINTTGGAFSIRKITSGYELVYGTTRNRIVSLGFQVTSAVYEIQKTSPAFTAQDVRGDVLIVHNSYSDNGKLHLSCLTQDATTDLPENNLFNWKYENQMSLSNKVRSDGRKRLLLSADSGNLHAFRCFGRTSATDVLAIVQFTESDYQSPQPTLRLNKGESFTHQLVKQDEDLPDEVYIRKLPSKWSSTPNARLPITSSSVHLDEMGIYIVHSSSIQRNRETNGAYFDIIVRDCERGKYGVDCQRECPQCQHGGQCHPLTGTCLCPPGFIGTRCQHACMPGRFGTECQLQCGWESLGFRPASEGKCRGLIICLQEPYGCSCGPGYTYSLRASSSNRICNQECPRGWFGADCSQSCDGCSDGDCDSFSGSCLHGCQSGASACIDAPSLPRAEVASLRRGLRVRWPTGGSDADIIYFLNYQFLMFRGCRGERPREPTQQKTVSSSPVELTDLLPYASYNVCLVASGSGGHSPQFCTSASTAAEEPDEQVTNLRCSEVYGGLTCDADVTDDCTSFNGPNLIVNVTLQTRLACNNSNLVMTASVSPVRTRVNAVFSEVLAGQNYTATATVSNSAGIGNSVTTSFVTREKKPPPVQGLMAGILDATTVQILWNDPCPANGRILHMYVDYRRTYLRTVRCNTSNTYDRCHTISGLRSGSTYTFKVQIVNKIGWSPSKSISIKLEETRPGPPETIISVRGSRQLELTIHKPSNPGGALTNCSLSFSGNSRICSIPMETPADTHNSPCKYEHLEPGKLYEAEAYCCNRKFCGDLLKMSVATMPLKPELSGRLEVEKKTNSTITLGLPAIITHGDGNSSLVVGVQSNQSNSISLAAEVERLILEGRTRGRLRKREAGIQLVCRETTWVAALLSQGTEEFVVGDGQTYNDFYNCPLEYLRSYRVGILAITELLGEVIYEWEELPDAEVVEPWVPEPPSLLLPLLLLFLLLVVITVGVVAYYLHRKQRWPAGLHIAFKKGKVDPKLAENEETPAENSEVGQSTMALAVPEQLQDKVTAPFDPTPDQSNGEIPMMALDLSYENLTSEGIYENISRRVPQEEVEAYLNRSIGSMDIKMEFKTVPADLNKSMHAAQHPSNKQKNRYRNNHPYDDTRVKLSIINDDPQSDYINANHVPGYSDMRYIAAQGPKNAKMSTIADFWRMILEQDINVIIMVANFVEGDKKKVGEYLRPGVTLEFDGHYVSVISKEQLPHFTVSTVQVLKKGYYHNVKHYHYTIWPDHGIPNEAVSIAHMIRHCQRNHQQGGIVVHCSAGIGRTGTVILVFLMCEMLALEGSLDPLEVLIRLRKARARLVENQAQYNLGLEILEEILFGEETIVSAHELETCLDKYLHYSLAEFSKVKALPSPLTFKTSSSPEFQSMNRNRSVLPADSQRIYLEMVHGQIESQYINAVQVAGLDNCEAFLVTEHPLPKTLAKFWRLVVEKGCYHVILINHFDELSKGEFPELLPEVGSVLTLAGCSVEVQEGHPYGQFLMEFTVNITISSQVVPSISHTVQIYQVLSWPFGQDVPPSPEILLVLAELLLQSPRYTNTGPPLLCCGDGVTGCGLVAAVSLLVERLQTEQCVNVYKTVKKLLRSRHQFITTKEQYSLLYSSAATYIRDYSTYGNFN